MWLSDLFNKLKREPKELEVKNALLSHMMDVQASYVQKAEDLKAQEDSGLSLEAFKKSDIFLNQKKEYLKALEDGHFPQMPSLYLEDEEIVLQCFTAGYGSKVLWSLGSILENQCILELALPLDPKIISHLSYESLGKKDLVLECIGWLPSFGAHKIVPYISPLLLQDADVMAGLLQNDVTVYFQLPKALAEKKWFVYAWECWDVQSKQNEVPALSEFYYASSQTVRSDLSLLEGLLRVDAGCYSTASLEHQRLPHIIDLALQGSITNYQFAGTFCESRSWALKALEFNPLFYEYVPASLKEDPALLQFAVKNNGYVWYLLPEKLKYEPSIVSLAMGALQNAMTAEQIDACR